MDTRIKRLQNQVHNPLLIENPVDLLYLTGLNLSRGKLWVSSKEVCLYVDGRYLQIAQEAACCPVRSAEENLPVAETALFDSAFTSYDAFLALKKKYPNVEWKPEPSPLKQMRAIKDKEEIAALKKACRLTLAGIDHVKRLYMEGVTEKELAFQFEFFCRKQGASGLSFEPIVAFGAAGAHPHYRAGNQKLRADQSVLIDVGAIVDGYRGDLTRTTFFGTPHPRLKQFDELVQEAFRAAFELANPGARIGDLDRAARKVFQKAGLEKLFIHSLGHGIGLETHEYPLVRSEADDILKAGMVFTIEPGLYEPGVGGIRFEEMVLVTETGAQLLYA